MAKKMPEEEKVSQARVFMEDGKKVVEASVVINRVVSGSAYGSAKYGEGQYEGEQPRGVSSTDTQEALPYFKAGIELELQKFGKPEYSQLLLGEDTDIQQGNISLGLDLSETQSRALHAIQKLLAGTDYQGNLEGREINSIDFKWRGRLPTYSMTYTEYYEAYGLEPAGDGRYHGAQVQQSIEAFKSLSLSRYYLVYDRTVRKDGKPVYKDGKPVKEAIRVTAPIIERIGELIQEPTEEELQDLRAGYELPERVSRIVFVPSPILLDRIHEGWYLLKPAGLYTEIQALYPDKHHAPRAVSLFIEWLLTLNKKEMSIGRRTLAEKLRMYSDIKNRRRSRIDKKITEALDVAKKLEYLLSYEIQPIGSRGEYRIDMKLNPERIKRIKSKMARSKKAEEETV